MDEAGSSDFKYEVLSRGKFTKVRGYELKEAIVKVIDGKKWVCCPQCGRKAFPVDDNTEIKNLSFQCKESRCKLLFKVNY